MSEATWNIDSVDRIVGLNETNGWVGIRQFLDPQELRGLCGEVELLTNSPAAFAQCMYFCESALTLEDPVLTRIERIWQDVDTLRCSVAGSRILELAGAIFGERANVFKDKVNFRWAQSEGYAAHQDCAGDWSPFGTVFISVVVFLDSSSFDHGGFEVVSNRHREGVFPNEGGRMKEGIFDGMSPAALVFEAGDLLILDSATPHRTGFNMRQEHAKHLILTFNPSSQGEWRHCYYERKEREFKGERTANCFAYPVTHPSTGDGRWVSVPNETRVVHRHRLSAALAAIRASKQAGTRYLPT